MKAKLKKRMKLPTRFLVIGKFKTRVYSLNVIRKEDIPEGKQPERLDLCDLSLNLPLMDFSSPLD